MYTNALGEDQSLSRLYAERTPAGRNIDALYQTERLIDCIETVIERRCA